VFTHFFIDRPILSSVISILIVLGGLVAMWVAPIEQYPELAPPQVTVEARYPGATAEVIANTVAAPIEIFCRREKLSQRRQSWSIAKAYSCILMTSW